MINGYQVFNGSMDGNRQVDPQIAVGGGYVMEGTNSGLMIYDKKGVFVQGVSQKCFNNASLRLRETFTEEPSPIIR